MNFCPTGTSTIVNPFGGGGPITVPLIGLDPDDGVIRVFTGNATNPIISFGSGDILLQTPPGIAEFFAVPDGVTSVNISAGGFSSTISITIGKFV